MPISWMNNLNKDKRDQMRMAATPLPFYLKIESFYIDKKTKVTYYIIQIGIQVGVEMQITNLAIRYSQLFKLNKAIRFRLQNTVQTAIFPPKKIFGNKSLPFLKRRRDALQIYLKSLTNIPNIFECKEFMEIFHISPDMISIFE